MGLFSSGIYSLVVEKSRKERRCCRIYSLRAANLLLKGSSTVEAA